MVIVGMKTEVLSLRSQVENSQVEKTEAATEKSLSSILRSDVKIIDY